MSGSDGERPWPLVIVGGGPAGMSAALVASQNRVEVLVLERTAGLGGQVRWADAPVPDLLGGSAGDGAELAERFSAHLLGTRARIRAGVGVRAVMADERPLRLVLDTREELSARRVLLATGLDHRRLEVRGEHLANAEEDPRKTLGSLRGKSVIVVGGGDEGASLARDLADADATVTMLVRDKLRARPAFGDPARGHPAVEIREGAVVSEIQGGDALEAVVLTTGERIRAHFCFVRIGAEPALPEIQPPLERLDDGRVRVDEALRTSCRRIFAAGDLVRSPNERYIAVALADGAMVARKVEEDLSAGA
ncbi:MAG: NAD(P)/FAD-dependent oxidoreductase [bacterium]|nr:NAD(P)/FAD-dependent oxidoreductase [bacterium]